MSDDDGLFLLEVVQGQRLVLPLDWQDDVTGDPIPLEGRAVRWQARTRDDSSSPLLLDLTAYLTVEPAGQLGRVLLDVPASVTRLVSRGGWHDCFCGDELWFEGQMTVNRATTAAP